MRLKSSRFVLLGVVFLGQSLLGCAQTVRTETYPGLQKTGLAAKTIAVAPLRAAGELARRTTPGNETSPTVATAIVARHLAESLSKRGLSVIPAQDVQRALGVEDGARARLVPRQVAQLVAERFGAEAVFLGEVTRYQDRKGEAMGATRAAAVGFRVTLYSAPDGVKLWSGLFDETQYDLSSNVLNAGRYPGGGTRWLTAEELTRWGASETMLAVPLSP